MFFLYSLLLTLAFIVLSPLLLIQSGKYLAGFWQRLGFVPILGEGNPVIWLHCVSVGETQAARPLIAELFNHFPQYRIVVSTTTKTGQMLAQELFKDSVDSVFYFPYDWKFSVRRALKRVHPNVVLLMETEIWFNFIRVAGKKDIRVIIVNGRLSEKSANRFHWVTNTFRRVFHYVDLALVQTMPDAKRFLAFGIRGTKIRVTGNIKFDQEISQTELKLSDEIEERFDLTGEVPLIIAASTHAPEEKLILDAFKILWKNPTSVLPRLIIVPRHPERFNEVTQLIRETGFMWAKRTENPSARDKSAEIILLDSIGELRSVYPLAEIVFVGGSLIPHGGQNVLEPAAAGLAIVTGHYTANFSAIIESFLENEAIIQLPKLSESEIPQKLAETFSELLSDDKKRLKLAENAFNQMQISKGATDKTIEGLRPFLDT